MKKKLLFLSLCLSSLFAAAQPSVSNGTVAFTPGNLVIYRFGDESTNKAGLLPAFIDEFTPSGELVRSIPLPTVPNGDNRRFMGGLMGQLRGDLISLSADGRYLTVIGLDGPRNGTAYASYPKVIARISGNGEVNTSTSIPTVSIGNTGRNVVTKDGTGFYTTGGAGQVRYVPFGFNAGVADANLATPPLVGGTNSGFALSIFNDKLYFAEHTSGASSNLAGVIGTLGTELPTPTEDMNPVAAFNALPLPNLTMPNQFVLLDRDGDKAPDLLYVIEIPAANTNSVIRKYSYEGVDGVFAWQDLGSFSHAKLKDGKGITARLSGQDAQIFVNTAPAAGKPTIVRINDPIYSMMANDAYTVHNEGDDPVDFNTSRLVKTILYASLQYKFNEATDGSTVNFRGIALAPTPFSLTSASKETEKSSFSVYLPENNRMQLSVPSEVASNNALVLVRDMTGRVLFQQEVKLAKGENLLQLRPFHLINGVYIVSVVTGKEVRSLKIAK
ncbi:T9SS type A sorting domain-containing protein [Rufibacter psychrotolerans]|uniref:T9SS type A sorting domain-containing protein n=1 Tax=Rufibacter psychrotolerans TaxID=2812556 RepID=UPI0019682FE7|nr:T9SS type A sorting domain-containing protein [Rufibacter sp. SYSU D00308]